MMNIRAKFCISLKTVGFIKYLEGSPFSGHQVHKVRDVAVKNNATKTQQKKEGDHDEAREINTF